MIDNVFSNIKYVADACNRIFKTSGFQEFIDGAARLRGSAKADARNKIRSTRDELRQLGNVFDTNRLWYSYSRTIKSN